MLQRDSWPPGLSAHTPSQAFQARKEGIRSLPNLGEAERDIDEVLGVVINQTATFQRGKTADPEILQHTGHRS